MHKTEEKNNGQWAGTALFRLALAWAGPAYLLGENFQQTVSNEALLMIHYHRGAFKKTRASFLRMHLLSS